MNLGTFMNEFEHLIETVIAPLQGHVERILDDINESSVFTSSERHQLSSQFSICSVTLSAYEHTLRTKRELSDHESVEFKTCCHDIASIIANFDYFSRELKAHWSNMNPGTEQEQVNA